LIVENAVFTLLSGLAHGTGLLRDISKQIKGTAWGDLVGSGIWAVYGAAAPLPPPLFFLLC
jgi:hypothetical protein